MSHCSILLSKERLIRKENYQSDTHLNGMLKQVIRLNEKAVYFCYRL